MIYFLCLSTKMTRFHLSNSLVYKRYFSASYNIKHEFNKSYSKTLSSNDIRKKFLDFFIKENDHKFVRSSPVMPFCDPTVAFVNAGMNQFKSIFLGQQDPLYKRVANSQKCVRVGGKHNDISIVGSDGYHHSFFEMLGNWSFGDYFKKDACEMAWKLLTGPYGLNPSSLYVTYFAGDPKLNLQPDLECREIWRSIGIADDHILAFGASDNFWEMGPTGPCGPCTEIHIDHTSSGRNRSSEVNRNLPDLTELWNIVFIHYNRNIDGSIHSLPKHHIDTGLGLERLTAILQGKSSNYDTDIFANLFECIQKNCRYLPEYSGLFGVNDANGIDTAYRVLADHSRMVTACLADGMIPEENQKLRRILRKSMNISETVFNKDTGLLGELSKVVSENLGHVYPEMEKNLDQVQQIIKYEEEVYKSIRSTATKDWAKIVAKKPKLQSLNVLEMPGLVSAYNELTSIDNIQSISPALSFKLYDTYGLDETTIASLAKALKLGFEYENLRTELNFARNRTKAAYLQNYNLQTLAMKLAQNGVGMTDDKFKYGYSKNTDNLYEFQDVNVDVLSIIQNEQFVEQIDSNLDCYLILNRTNLYSESGGQISDVGIVEFSNGNMFQIVEIANINGYIFHRGIASEKLRNGDCGKLVLNKEKRLSVMRNHTATHLLNAALKKVVNGVTCQKSSKVTPNTLSFDVGIYSKKLSIDDIENVELLLRNIIKNQTEVRIREINSQQLLNLNNVTLVPGEVYPEVGIRLIEIEDKKLFSREPCCGTHVLNTSDIQDICIINFRSSGRSTTTLTAVTGDSAILAHRNGAEIYKEVKNIQSTVKDTSKDLEVLDLDLLTQIKQKLNNHDFIMPVYVKLKCQNFLTQIGKQLRDAERDSLKQFVDLEMASVIETNCHQSKNNNPYIVHFLNCSSILDNVPLQRATKVCANIPVIVISFSDDMVKARCCVPENLVSADFNAELWLKNTVSRIFKSSASAPRGQDAAFVVNMKAKRITKIDWDSKLDIAISAAKKFAHTHL